MRSRSSKAERVGRWLGRAWQKVVRREKQFSAWLVLKGISVRTTDALVWAVRLVCLAIIASFSVIFAAAVVILLTVASLSSRASITSDETATEWRNGVHGFGLYNREGFRIDPYDPNDEA